MKLKLKVYKITFKYKCFTQNKQNQYLSYAIFIILQNTCTTLADMYIVHVLYTYLFYTYLYIHVYLNIQKKASTQFI